MQDREIDVSVIIPCRDHSLELGRCLQTVRAQEFAGSFEVIVVDAGLDDDLLRLEDSGTRVVRAREPLHPGSARNLGAARAAGRWLCFIDADAVAEPGWLSAATAALRNGAHVVGGAVLQGERWHPVATIDNLMQFADFVPGRPPGPSALLPSCNLAISRADFAVVGGFPVLDCTAGEDVLFCANAARRWPGALCFEPSMRVRHYGRDTLRAFREHQRHFGVTRARYGLQLTDAHRRLGRSALLVPLLGVRRVGYLVQRALQWQPAALIAYALALPVLLIGITAWCRGFYHGLASAPAPETSRLRETR
jgi:glycosyltransferase involved in cell wall biosynthesis